MIRPLKNLTAAALMRLATVAFLAVAALSCGGRKQSGTNSDNTSAGETDGREAIVVEDSTAEVYSDTLRAVTLYGPTSYFIYRGEPMGLNYSLLKEFAADSHKALKLSVAPTIASAIEMLDDGQAELLAYEVPITAHYRDLVLACGPEEYSTQVLVQPRIKGEPDIKDVTQLVGKEVYVIGDSKYERRMRNLNEELAAEIDVRTISPDSATAEDLIAMVSTGEIPLTIVDSDIARLNETYFHDLDISTEVSLPQRSSWAVAKGNHALADEVDLWFERNDPVVRYGYARGSETSAYVKRIMSFYDNAVREISL